MTSIARRDTTAGAAGASRSPFVRAAASPSHGHAPTVTARVATALAALLAAGAAAQSPQVRESGVAGARMGWAVASAGDVNRDGYWDVIAGAPGYSNGEEREGAAFLYLGGPTGLSTSPAWSVEGGQVGAAFGASVWSAGDVNGDLFMDVIVGAPGHDVGEAPDSGRAYVFLGSAGGLLSTPHWIGEIGQAGARFGASVGLGDTINADRYADVMVGAPAYDGGEEDEGAVFAYFGSSSGLSTSPAWSVESDSPGAQLGGSLSTAGDVNGDALLDVVVGAMYWEGAGVAGQGRAYVYFGTPTGLASTPGWTVEGAAEWSFLGGSVSTAGDVNGDGYWDVLVGAWSRLDPDRDHDEWGLVQLHAGSPSGPTSSPVWAAPASQAYAMHGLSVSTSLDSDGDGLSDVLLGAPNRNGPETDLEGRVELYRGTPFGPAAAPSSTFDGGASHRLLGHSVSFAGDVNGDGSWDFVAGAPGYSSGQEEEGAVYLYLGTGGGSTVQSQ